jgi:hypothetical protein
MMRSITALVGFGLLVGACSEAAPPGGAMGHGGSGGVGSDATTPPPPDGSGAAGTDAGSSPPVPDATTPIDSGGGVEDAPVAPPRDAPSDTATPARDSGDAASPSFDAGVVLGCAGNPRPPDPTVGWTEYADTYPPAPGVEFPDLEYPYDLGPQDNCTTNLPIDDRTSPCRFRREGGLMTFWIFQNDKTHSPPDSGLAPTDPRIELHWSTFTAKDPHPRRMWTGDVAVLGDGKGTPPAHNTILQVHTEATGAGPVYLRVEGGKLFQLGGPTYYSPTIGTWFNLKVAFDATTAVSTIWVNNCQVGTYDGSSYPGRNSPGGDIFYFKNGSYGCTTGECIVKFANVRFHQK